MSVLRFGLDWFVDQKGYRVEGSGRSRTIVRIGGDLRRTYPLENHELFRTFAKVRSQPELLSFVQNYGLLEHAGDRTDYGMTAIDPDSLRPIQSRPVIFGEYVEDHLETARMFAKLMALTGPKGRASAKLSDFINDRLLDDQLGRISWGFCAPAGLTMQLTANTLLNGMLMQLVQTISAQPALRLCAFCKIAFAVGPNTGRRADAIFCSLEHKIQFHSRKRSIRSK
jgi:hypothetical protein